MTGSYSKTLIAATVLAGALSLGGCATKGYVNQQVGKVDSRVTTQDARLTDHDAKLEQLDQTTRDAMQRAEAAGKLAEGKFLYTMVLQDDSVKFRIDKADLSPEDQTRLQTFVDKLKNDNHNVYVEIQGHTDATGPKDLNYRLGEERAEAVRLFLNKQGIALNRLATISYGPDSPAEPNTTREGRAANRRVVLVVMA
ncbi:MAG TPA: OmpA family protein [Caulobacteraceae bacterium]|jgi:outer membrane protein OmpA-like peptidoglycan-associated protein|nr:OmpA family protein [Caulobacteraceae bacterium]